MGSQSRPVRVTVSSSLPGASATQTRLPAALVQVRALTGTANPRRTSGNTYLTGEYGIARTTAGKALRVLVNDGLAVMSPGMGVYVRKPK